MSITDIIQAIAEILGFLGVIVKIITGRFADGRYGNRSDDTSNGSGRDDDDWDRDGIEFDPE